MQNAVRSTQNAVRDKEMALIIEVQKIPPEGMRIEGRLPAGELGLDYRDVTASGDLCYDLKVQLAGKELLAAGSLNLPFRARCSRCLKPLNVDIKVGEYSFATNVAGKDTIDLTESVREYIIIDLPLKPLCKEDCKGICQRCGKNLNTGSCTCERRAGDARWNPLGDLKLPSESDQ